jgi:hypothetical protein
MRQVAWVVGEEIGHRERAGIPIPQALTSLHRALQRRAQATPRLDPRDLR